MTIEAELSLFLKKLDKAIDSSMQNEVTDGAKKELQRTIDTNVYSYSPAFYSRRLSSGGIKDEQNMTSVYTGGKEHELSITDDAGWQHLYGGEYPSSSLSDVIATGMYGAPARRFIEDAELNYASGEFEIDLLRGLFTKGF